MFSMIDDDGVAFFTTQQFFSAICGPERRKNLFQRLVAQNDAKIYFRNVTRLVS